jgi:energy-converting hydrogenase B subunit D
LNALLAVLLTLVAVAATATVLTRDPLHQSVVLGVMGLLLALVFYVLQAPDVALSELAVGSIAIPVMLTLAIAKLRAQDARRTAEERPPEQERAPEPGAGAAG